MPAKKPETTPEVGAFGYEQTDADQFARWGWDYIKVDDHGPGNFYSIARAIVNNSSGRPVVLSLSTPHTFPYEFAPRIANLWRVGQDITLRIGYVAWKDILREFDAAGKFWWAQAPGRWNDLDMLVIGLVGINDEEAKSHFSMWAIRGAPLLIGADIRPPHERSFGPIPRLTLRDLESLKNKEVIAVDQDRLGASGRVISRERNGMEVDAKPLSSFASGDYAVLLLNRSSRPHDVTVTWHSLGLLQKGVSVRDLWKHSDLGSFVNQFTAHQVPPHGVVMLRVHGSVDWSVPREYEAEWSYNSLTGSAHTYCEGSRLQGATSDCVVDGIGGKPENKLQFNELWEGKAGLYHVSIRYAASQSRQARITVNDQPPVTVRFPANCDREI
jgi:alpha-galactosidase